MRTAFILSLYLIGWIGSVDVFGGEPVYVGSSKHLNRSMDAVDHSPWDQLLQKYVDSNGRVNYSAWKSATDDLRALDRYLSELSAANVSVSATSESRLAFWINAYNAVTVRGILREYPTTSIRNHTARLFGYNIWKDLKLYVGGKAYSLDQIEHELLRKMGEPRIHFAIVCASIGCPRLLNRAYVSDRLENQLEENAKHFFSQRQNFRYDAAAKRFYLSAILDWFGEDFGASQAKVLQRIAAWLPTESAIVAAKNNTVRISYLDYDWNLNKQ